MRALALIFLMVAAGLAGCATSQEPELDSDGDGISDRDEAALGTNPNLADSDGDGILDKDELDLGRNPNVVEEILGFLPAVDLLCGSDTVTGALDAVHRRSCGGFAEPVMDIQADGKIWVSATCCVGRSPPIWTSTDGGLTFVLEAIAQGTGVARDATGIEGDFAVDTAGNVYFFDIMLATSYFTKFNADGSHAHTITNPLPPLVDRPWVRAGAADEVFIFYNTGTSTNFFTSDNGGLTFDYQGYDSFPCALMTMGQGAERDRLFVAGCPGAPGLWITEDKGVTWTAKIDLPAPQGGRIVDNYFQSAADAAGNIYVTMVVAMDGKDDVEQRVFLDIVHPDGNITGPIDISGPGWAEKPWPAAGDDGKVAIAYYHTNGTVNAPEEWYVKTAWSLDASTKVPLFENTTSDPQPVLPGGGFGRRLGDFLEARMGPDGRFYITYAYETPSDVINRVVVSEGVNFGRGVPYA